MLSTTEFERQSAQFKRTIQKAHSIVVSSRAETTLCDNHTSSHDGEYPVLDKAAFYGLPGEFVRAIEPATEADPAGVLFHVLTSLGCLIGPRPHVLVERTAHPPRINCLIVGRSATARKGTAWSSPKYLLTKVNPEWATHQIKSGLSSGEGLIDQVQDPSGQDDVVGAEDKRLLVVETEFSAALRTMERSGNTLSAILRDAWDHGNLSTLTRHNHAVATGAHICIVGHITTDEILRLLNATEQANGFANRFLFALVKRSKFLPSGRGISEALFDSFARRFGRVVEAVQTRGVISRDAEAEDLWASLYPEIEEDRPGLTATILARGAAQITRLSLVYALLDEAEAKQSETAIRVQHLLAALAAWEYAKGSTHKIFGDSIGDPVADRMLLAIRSGPCSDTDLYELLGKRDGDRKAPALDRLLRLGCIHGVRETTAGRPITWWHCGTKEQCTLCVERV